MSKPLRASNQGTMNRHPLDPDRTDPEIRRLEREGLEQLLHRGATDTASAAPGQAPVPSVPAAPAAQRAR